MEGVGERGGGGGGGRRCGKGGPMTFCCEVFLVQALLRVRNCSLECHTPDCCAAIKICHPVVFIKPHCMCVTFPLDTATCRGKIFIFPAIRQAQQSVDVSGSCRCSLEYIMGAGRTQFPGAQNKKS